MRSNYLDLRGSIAEKEKFSTILMKENVHDGYLRVSLQLIHFHNRLLAFEYADIPLAFGKGWCGSARFLFPP